VGDAANENISEIDARAISLTQLHPLDSTHDLIQLAHILTPPACNCARKQLMGEIGTSRSRRGDGQQSESAHVLSLATFPGQLPDYDKVIHDTRSVVIESSIERGQIEEEDNGEEIQEHGEPAIGGNVVLEVRNIGRPDTDLFQRARNGLHRLITQWHFNLTERNNTLQALDRLVSQTEAELGLVRPVDRGRFCWLSLPRIHPEFTLLSEIALRLEPLICSEAPSERTIGQQRRFLTSHRTRTNTDLLLTRTEIEEVQRLKA
jgi:hypothetical protein